MSKYTNDWRQRPNNGSRYVAPSYDGLGSRRPRREQVRFGINKGRNYTLVLDEHIQEATPEHLRIEIDKIFKDFLADPGKTEHIFPPEFDNLQRKYIHYKAQIMNVISKSHGKPPNRQLHLKKKPKQVSSKSFQITPCQEIFTELEKFEKTYGNIDSQPNNYRAVKRYEKVYGKLQDSEAVVPKITHVDREIQTIRKNLPIFEKRETVMEAINNNQVIIVSSETGSGKTTQIPQYIMEDYCYKNQPCKIICTQPRRISTIAAAERVAYERGENVGASVGYHIRLESKCGYNTNLMYCTVGVFLRNLMCGNKCLNNITHVIIDEIHERDKLSDFLLICIRQNLPLFPHLKVILMSATMNMLKFQEYFKTSTVLSLPGRLFPIQSYFLEDILSMTQFFTPQMRSAMSKLQQKQLSGVKREEEVNTIQLCKEDQENFDCALEAYMNFCDDYDYSIHYEEATADLLQLFISEDVPVDVQHSQKGWTALMIACHLGDVEFVSKLCTMGASLSIADKLGKTAFDYGNVSGKNNIIQLLNFIKDQKMTEQSTPNTNDSQYLRQLYDMTTPDDFIDFDLIVALIKYVHVNSDSGSILIFLPGYDEIMRCNDGILNSDLDPSSYRVFFLHSSMNMKDQCDVFKSLPVRKIILSTNIAETSITIEDVVFVIDVGKAKEKVYDSYNKLSALQTQWISRACSKQREGRAGRVRPGVCFRLYSNQRFNHMAEEKIPEILRVSLEELCLHAKIIAPSSMNIYNFLSLAPDPPTTNAVAVAIENLQSLGALDKEEDLTRLGEYLAQLTLEPRLGKMLIYGCIFKCLEPLLTLAASMAHKDPFQLPPQANLKTAAAAKRRELIENIPSDHVVYLKVFQKWQEEACKGRSKQFCHEFFISESTMHSVLETRRQLLGQLRAVGFVNNTHCIDEFNVNSNSWGLVKAIMSAAFFPNIAYPVQNGLALATRNEKKLSIHSSSVCNTKSFNYWCFYDEMVKNKFNFLIRGVTLCTTLSVAMMCGVDTIYPTSHSVTIDDWLEFYFSDSIVVKFRTSVQNLIEKSLLNPWHSFDQSNKIVSDTLKKILDIEENQSELIQPRNVGVRPKFLYKVVHENNASRRNAPINREGMRHRENSGANYGTTNEWIDNHKKGRTPKRFIPPSNKYHVSSNSAIAKSLSFDNYGAVSSVANDINSGFQNISISQGLSNPADVLLKGLGVQTDFGENIYNDNSYYSRAYTPRSRGTHRNLSYNNNLDSCNARKIVKQNSNTLDFGQQFAGSNTILSFYDLGIPSEESLYNYNNQSIPHQTFFTQTEAYFHQNQARVLYQPSPVLQSEKLSDFRDNPIFLIIRASEKRNIDIAQSCNKWVFSPQTEKKVVTLAGKGKTIYLVFYVKELSMFMGIAEYKSLNIGRNYNKPTASIVWKFSTPLHKNRTKHLLNPYNFSKPIYDAQDGVIIQQEIGEELIRIYTESEERHPH